MGGISIGSFGSNESTDCLAGGLGSKTGGLVKSGSGGFLEGLGLGKSSGGLAGNPKSTVFSGGLFGNSKSAAFSGGLVGEVILAHIILFGLWLPLASIISARCVCGGSRAEI